MSILNSIMEKLGLKKAEMADEEKPKEQPVPAVPQPGQKLPPQAMAHIPPDQRNKYTPAPSTMAPNGPGPATPPVPPVEQPKQEMSKVDLTTHLDYLAKTGPIKGLNWRVSINDFMALLGMEHTPAAIKELAVELGCPEKEMMDSYTRNVWTHAALMKKLAENGGELPANLVKK